MEAAVVGRSTVKRMAGALRKLGDLAFDMTWADVRKQSFPQELDEMGDNGRDAWKEEKARKLADYLVKGPNLTRDPQITARALEMVSSLLPGQLTSQWPAEARENLTAHVEEVAPDKAGALMEVLDALYGWESL